MATLAFSGGEKLQEALEGIAKRAGKAKELKVGFMEGATYPDGTSVAMVAAIQNFGAPAAGIPPRPFFSNMVAEKSPNWGKSLGNLLKASDYDGQQSLEQMGMGIAGQLQQSIQDTDGPANSPVTNLLKQRFPMGGQTFQDVQQARADIDSGEGESAPAGKPLIWTGHMQNSVDYDVDGQIFKGPTA